MAAGLGLLAILVCAELPALAASPPDPAAEAALAKIDAQLQADIAEGSVGSFFILMSERADLSGASKLQSKSEKGRYVYERLRAVAERTQRPVREAIARQGLRFEPFFIINGISVHAPEGGSVALSTMVTLAARRDVARIEPLRAPLVPDRKEIPARERRTQALPAAEPNIEQIGAAQLHELGIDGAGVVIGISDTGTDWTHPALQSRYRGRNTGHEYNWFDPTVEDSPVPVDTIGHGTHTTGIAVGGAPGERIGVAPGAEWISCRALGPGANRETVLWCLEFFLAPTDLYGDDPDPSRAPDVTTHSYICPFCGLEDAFQALRDAGIESVAAAGNFGPTCGSLFDPGTYANVISVGAVQPDGEIAEFSSRGPWEGLAFKPDIVAPGVEIRSSVPGGYDVLSGTSEAVPHVAGAIALVWSAIPTIRGDLGSTRNVLFRMAIDHPTTECESTTLNNNVYGRGVLNVAQLATAAVPALSVWELAALGAILALIGVVKMRG